MTETKREIGTEGRKEKWMKGRKKGTIEEGKKEEGEKVQERKER